MRCSALGRGHKQCKNKAKIGTYCMIHTKKKYFITPSQQNKQGVISLGRVRKKSYVDKNIPYYEPILR